MLADYAALVAAVDAGHATTTAGDIASRHMTEALEIRANVRRRPAAAVGSSPSRTLVARKLGLEMRQAAAHTEMLLCAAYPPLKGAFKRPFRLIQEFHGLAEPSGINQIPSGQQL